MSLICTNNMKKMTCNSVILSSKMTYMCYIFKINIMKIYLKITVNIVILGSKNNMFLKINDMK